MKSKFLLPLILFVVLSSCDKPRPQCLNAQCPAVTAIETLEMSLAKVVSEQGNDPSEIDPRSRVFTQMQDFDIVPLLFACNEINREKVFQVIVDECRKLGDVNVTEAKPLIESLFADPPKDVNGLLSIGTDFQFGAKFVISSKVKMIPNGCETSCIVWERTSYANAASDDGLTDQACQVVEDIVKQFGEAYREANPDPNMKPIFKIRNVITSL